MLSPFLFEPATIYEIMNFDNDNNLEFKVYTVKAFASQDVKVLDKDEQVLSNNDEHL